MILISQWSGSYYVPLVYRWPIYPECQGARHLLVLDLNTALILRSFSLTKLQTRHHSQEWARIWSILETTNLYYTSMIETEEQGLRQLHAATLFGGGAYGGGGERDSAVGWIGRRSFLACKNKNQILWSFHIWIAFNFLF